MYRGEREVTGLALDRESIERKDFSIVKQGYDPGAVAARLSAIADEVEGFQGSPHGGRADTLAGAVSEQVRGIVDAAESSAAEILREAELEAQEIRAQASRAAEHVTGEFERRREQAASQARDQVARISSSVSQLLGRLDAIDGDLNALTASLRTDTERLRDELRSLESELGETMAGPELPEEAPPVAFSRPAAAAEDVSQPVSSPVKVPEPPGDVSAEPAAEPSPGSAKIGDEPPEAAPAHEADAPHGAATDAPQASAAEGPHGSAAEGPQASVEEASDDSEGARLIALNMALNGTPREETARYLAENYNLADRERLLDEVYESVQG
jgi:cell division septum initiation protein DivIVA